MTHLRWEIFLCPSKADGQGASLSFCFTSCLPLFGGFLYERGADRIPQPPPPEGRGNFVPQTLCQSRKTDAIPMPYPLLLGEGAGGGVSWGRVRRRPFRLRPTFAGESAEAGEGYPLCRLDRTETTPARRAGRTLGIDRPYLEYEKRIVKKIIRSYWNKLQQAVPAYAQPLPTGPSTGSGQARDRLHPEQLPPPRTQKRAQWGWLSGTSPAASPSECPITKRSS